MRKYKSLFITPFYKYQGDINSPLNVLLIDSLDRLSIRSMILTSHKCRTNSDSVLRVRYSCMWRVIIKISRIIAIPFKFDFLPDLFYWIWGKKAINTGVKYLKKNSIDFLHSISIPYSSHLVALKLKKKYNIPWIAHFYEPWCDNTYRKSTPYVMKKNKEWERLVVENADIIIHNSKRMCDSWLEKYGRLVEDKLAYLPMPLNVTGEKKEKKIGNKIIISHIGNLYGLRNSSIFLKALNECLKDNITVREKLKINFIGKVSDVDIDTVKQLQLEGIVNFVGKLTEEECVEYYNNSDVFLVIEGQDQGPLFFPSKLIKYLYYERPIIGITESGSVLDQLLIENGHNSYTHDNIKGIADYIAKAVNSYDSLLSFKRDAWKEYEISNVVEKYMSIVDKLLQINNNNN